MALAWLVFLLPLSRPHEARLQSQSDSQGNPVVKVMVNEQIREKSVVLGISDGYQTEIVGGLHEGETVIIETPAKPEPSGGFFFGH